MNNTLATRIFFKEIKDSSGYKDSKYLYAYDGEVKQGDVVTVDGNQWIMIQEDISYHKQYTRFIATEANQNINFVIDEGLYTMDGIIDAGNQSVSGNASTMSVIDGKIMVTVQRDTMSEKIKTNDRIIKFGQAWKIITTTTESNGLLNIYCESDILLPDDDKINEIPTGIASWGISFAESSAELTLNNTITLEPIVTKNNQIVVDGFELEWSVSDDTVLTMNNGVVWSNAVGSSVVTVGIVNKNASATLSIEVVNNEVIEYKITPSDRIVYSIFGAMDFSVNKYVNGVIVPSTAIITAYGLLSSQYTLEVVDGNNFRLTSNGYVANPLTVVSDFESDGVIIETQFNMWNM
ncbi:MAG: hypothetical protein SCL54_06975 [Bacillota bacterium]|nr:hypothetical protein [Bacillota bacterium]